MKIIHIGHHFFGSGNLGDDLMLAGFLEGIKSLDLTLSCCIPHPIDCIAKRFPTIRWKTYTQKNRSDSIEQCDLWLGLGGSPFQSNVSDWFITHLESEYNFCKLYRKPMAFIGIGSQDPGSFTHPILKKVVESASAIWTRDKLTYDSLNQNFPIAKCYLASDLAHIYLKVHRLSPIKSQQLSVAFNFDYQEWPNLSRNISALAELRPSEQLWLVQESRPLPGSEQWLYDLLPQISKKSWKVHKLDNPELPLIKTISSWPSSEWLLSSRFHTTLVSAWAGTKTVVLNTNAKLLSAALEFGYEALSLESTPEKIIEAFDRAKPPSKQSMYAKASLAQQSIDQLISQFDLKA